MNLAAALIEAWDEPPHRLLSRGVASTLFENRIFIDKDGESRRDQLLPHMPRLYTIMRNDLQSLNAGKAVAQGQHAANKVVYAVKTSGREHERDIVRIWEEQTNCGFGTSIVLDGAMNDIASAIRWYKDTHDDDLAGIVHDSSYPLKDGQVTHLIPLETCGYIIGFPHHVRPFLAKFDMMP